VRAKIDDKWVTIGENFILERAVAIAAATLGQKQLFMAYPDEHID